MRYISVRFSIILTVLFTCIIFLAGCGASEEPTSTQSPLPENTPAIIPEATEPPLPAETQSLPPTSAPTQVSPTESQPAITGEILLDTRCTVCHSKSRVASKTKTLEEWQKTVESMVKKGAVLTPEEITILVDYLAKTYGP